MHKCVSELVAGDKTNWYVVQKVEKKGNNVIIAEVVYNDGGTGKREWFDPETLIEVKE